MRYSVGVTYGVSDEEREILFESNSIKDAKKRYYDQMNKPFECLDGPTYSILDNETGHLFQSEVWYKPGQ